MKKITNLTVIAATLVLLAKWTFSQEVQTDSIVHLKEADFSFYETKNIMNQRIGKITPVKYLSTVDDVTSLVFKAEDSVALLKDEGTQTFTSLSDINEVRKYKYRLSPILTGSAVGVLVGGGIGALIGWAVTKKEGLASDFGLSGAVIGAPISALLGGIMGGLIGSTFDYITLDMSAVSDKDKKAKLIRFLKQNKKSRESRK